LTDGQTDGRTDRVMTVAIEAAHLLEAARNHGEGVDDLRCRSADCYDPLRARRVGNVDPRTALNTRPPTNSISTLAVETFYGRLKSENDFIICTTHKHIY